MEGWKREKDEERGKNPEEMEKKKVEYDEKKEEE